LESLLEAPRVPLGSATTTDRTDWYEWAGVRLLQREEDAEDPSIGGRVGGSLRDLGGGLWDAMETETAAGMGAAVPTTIASAVSEGGPSEVRRAQRRSSTERPALVPRRTRMVPIVPGEGTEVVGPLGLPEGWTDALTGTEGPLLWERLITTERARVTRYHRPVTVAFAEVVGLDRLAGAWGSDVAVQALAACARRLKREIRTSDQVARIERARFAILLTETNEVAAINFVERARASCEVELEPYGADVRIGFGWASPPSRGDLSDALALGTERLAADLRAGQPG
jgi:diguanylate cyclase (GGDEF)-like protein